MTAVKWLFIIICAPIVAMAALYLFGTLGLIAYFYSAEATTFTPRDFSIGAVYKGDERAQFRAACVKRFNSKGGPTERTCNCWTDTAENTASPFERIGVAALLGGNTHAVVGLGKSLVASGIREHDIERYLENIRVRYNRIGLACI